MSLLFHVLFEHWEAADFAAERAWRNLWRKLDSRMRGLGPAPAQAEIADVFLLRREAHELLQALRLELSEARGRGHLLPQGDPDAGRQRSQAPGSATRSCGS